MKSEKVSAALPAALPSALLKHLVSQSLPCSLVTWEKGELLTRMEEKNACLSFVLSGTIRIFGLDQEGTDYSVVSASDNIILGGIEFLLGCPSPYYTEALDEVQAICFPLAYWKETFEQDAAFLLELARHTARTQLRQSQLDIEPGSLAGRLLHYLQLVQRPVMVQELLANLHCSRRHLQRVLKEQCLAGTLVRLKQGCYALPVKKTREN